MVVALVPIAVEPANRLGHLLRGRAGTEWAAGIHSIGESFALLEPDAVRLIELPDWTVGSQTSAAVIGNATEAVSIMTTGESLRPPSPVRLVAELKPTGDLALTWIRRSRRGWAWLDEIDAPLGESREAYRVSVTGWMGSIELDAGASESTIPASDLAIVGPGEASIEVRQIGDWAASRPAQRTIIIP